MMNTPKISILVPVYNVEKYLQRCVDSVLAQDFTNWEMILVDDGALTVVRRCAMRLRQRTHG